LLFTQTIEINKFLTQTVTQQPTKSQIMYALKNKVQLIGNLGNAPEIKTLDSGKKWLALV
jgi:single-strand DNA-binding protein